MRNIIITSFVVHLLSVLQLVAQTTVNSDGLQINAAFVGSVYNSPSLDSEINCKIVDVSSNAIDTIIYEPERSYFYLVDLFDSNGVAVSKTMLGKQTGSRFSDLDSEVDINEPHITFDNIKTLMSSGNSVYISYSGNDIKSTTKRMRKANGNKTRLPTLSALSSLFYVTNSGEYTLRLHFQIFKLIRPQDKFVKLVRFPLMEVKFSVKTEDLKTMKQVAVHENLLSPTSTPTSARAQEISQLQVKSSQALNITNTTLAFAGYDSPDSALETWLWACFQGDRTNMLQSLTPEEQEDYKHAFDGKTDVQMKTEAARIGSHFSGYTVQKMDVVSDTLVILNYAFTDSDLLQ